MQVLSMKNIVALDAYTLSPLQPGEHSPQHPSWDAIAEIGPLTLYPRSREDEIVPRGAEAEILLTNKAVISAAHIAALPRLEYIGVMATGTNVVDLDAARARNIRVTNVPGYGANSVSQHVFALLLELAVRAGASDMAVKNGDWTRCPDFCFTITPIVELHGKTLGIVGFGAIGQVVAKIGSAFGMRILAYSRTQKPTETPVEWAHSLDQLFAESDAITLHCPLTDETNQFINRENLGKMKRSAYLINTGRGPLVNEADLAQALRDGVIAGYGADVLSKEPPPAGNPLLNAPNTVITPHNAWASIEARKRLMDVLVANLRAYLAGTPQNVVA
jgi:glycerate dehydrogenase